MQIDLEFAELHGPLFLAGTNLQMKLDPHKRTGLKLVYDRAEKELLVTFNGKTAIIPSSNIVSMTPGAVKEPVVAVAPPSGKAVKAQASSPQSHVFEPGKPLSTRIRTLEEGGVKL